MAKKHPTEITPPSTPAETIRRELDVDDNDGTADEASVRNEGAINAAAVDANRRQKAAVGLKRAGTPRVSFGDDNACNVYDATILIWAPATLQILVERLGASKTSYYVTSEPRNGQEALRRDQPADPSALRRVRVQGQPQGQGEQGLPRDRPATLPNTLGDAHVPIAPGRARAAAAAARAESVRLRRAAAGARAAPARCRRRRRTATASAARRAQRAATAARARRRSRRLRPSPRRASPGAPPPGAPPPPPGSMIFLQGVGWVKVEGNQPAPPRRRRPLRSLRKRTCRAPSTP